MTNPAIVENQTTAFVPAPFRSYLNQLIQGIITLFAILGHNLP